MDVASEMPPQPRRRWFRYSLRRLLILVTLLSVPLGWVGWELNQVSREQAAITWVKKKGGGVYFRSEFKSDNRSWWEKSTDMWFGERVWMVSFDSTQVSDLSPLAELKNLQRLSLDNTQVSDLSPLAELKNLQGLEIYDTQVSDEQVQELRQALPNCEIVFTTVSLPH